ncbi:protein ytfJ precursor [Vibrio ishigakensis]|nr:protein ytfJ precursor [Vibrio ishigakensis]
MVGKTRVIQAIAGRSAAKALNKPMIDAIIEADFPQDKYQTTTIVNQDDSVWGTGSFVKSSAEDSKREFPHSSIVLDEDGAVAKAWDLEPKTSMIAVQDKDGNILWAKEGELTSTEVQQVITLLKENL